MGILALGLAGFVVANLSGCSTSSSSMGFGKGDAAPKRYSVDIAKIPNAKPKTEPRSRYGNPSSYVVQGKRYYVLNDAVGYNRTGIASWYGTKFHGKLTSNRERYDMFAMTAASTTLPLPTYVRVTNLTNGESVIVRVNDRGPFLSNRLIDLSYAAAKKLDYTAKGTAMVRVTAINPTTWSGRQPITVHPAKHPKLYLQLGAFASRANAEHLSQQLAHYTRSPTRIETSQRHNQPIYRVQIGPLLNTAEADRIQMTLAENNMGNAISVVK